MAKYTKRADGRYQTRVTVGYTDDGKPIIKYFYDKTSIGLDKKITEYKALYNKGIIIKDGDNVTVQSYANEWLNVFKGNKSINTYNMYKRVIDKYIIDYLGLYHLNAVKPNQIQKLINDLSVAGKFRTAEQVYLTLKQIFKSAISQDYLYKNPCDNVQITKRPKPQKRALTNNELQLIRGASLDPRERAFIGLLYYCGLRRGEALAVSWNDIDLKKNRIHIHNNIVFDGTKSVLKDSPKTNASNRVLIIPNALKTYLDDYKNICQNEYLFTLTRGSLGFMTKSSFRRFWGSIISKINVASGGQALNVRDRLNERVIAPDITPHLFRHTFATNLYNANVDVKTAQVLLGHSSITVTMDIYTHLNADKITTAENQINSYFDAL